MHKMEYAVKRLGVHRTAFQNDTERMLQPSRRTAIVYEANWSPSLCLVIYDPEGSFVTGGGATFEVKRCPGSPRSGNARGDESMNQLKVHQQPTTNHCLTVRAGLVQAPNRPGTGPGPGHGPQVPGLDRFKTTHSANGALSIRIESNSSP